MKKISEKLQVLGLLIVGIVISSIIATKAATTLSSTSVYYDTSKSGGTSSNVNGAIDELYSLTTDRDKLKTDIVNIIYPVGSIYMSTEDDTVEKVQDKFGGIWERYAEGTMLMSADSNHAVNTTGGSSTATLSSKNIPSLSVTGTTNSTGNGYNIGYTYTTRTTIENGNHTHLAGFHFVTPINENGTLWTVTGSSGGDKSNLYWSNGSSYVDYSGNHSHNYNDYYASSLTGVEAHTHIFTGNYTNSSPQSINIQNPYTAVYMYKRTS